MKDFPNKRLHIATIGAGRMARGIALSYCMAGHAATILDIKSRSASDQDMLKSEIYAEIEKELHFLAELELFSGEKISDMLKLVNVTFANENMTELVFDLVFEAVPEHEEAKKQAFGWMSKYLQNSCVVASTTSTFLVSELSCWLSNPSRFANAHWLNPAHLMPLVEISCGEESSDETIEHLSDCLKAVGKVPIVMKSTPGYIVPRIQALALNEAARLVEEGVASAEDIDKAIRTGFGVRYAVLGMLEFIDWGGGDILYYASDYMSKAIDADRYQAPDIVKDNMHQNRNGLKDGEGFFDYKSMDIDAYRRDRLSSFISLLKHLSLPPETL